MTHKRYIAEKQSAQWVVRDTVSRLDVVWTSDVKEAQEFERFLNDSDERKKHARKENS